MRPVVRSASGASACHRAISQWRRATSHRPHKKCAKAPGYPLVFKCLSDNFASDALTHLAVVRSKMASAVQGIIDLHRPRRAGARNTM
nr:hypothetical protein WG70_23595 [Burkholderia oklahomensis EO147]